MNEVITFSPGHITGLFEICDQSPDPLYQGSRGAGVSITRGVITKVNVERSSRTSIRININGVATPEADVSEHVVKSFLSRQDGNFSILVEHDVNVPIAAGYGSSGAGALSLSLALNEALDQGLSRVEAAQVAHIAEVECKTGLGTVIAETYGGLEIRVKPGAPGIGELKKIEVSRDYVVACLNFGSMPTKRVLANNTLRQFISECGGKLVDELIVRATPISFMQFSREFSEQIGLYSDRIVDVLRDTDGKDIICSMPMFGESVFTLIKRNALDELLEIFYNHANSQHDIIVSGVDLTGARVL